LGLVEEELLKVVYALKVKSGAIGPGDDVDCFEMSDVYLCVNIDGFPAKGVMMPFMNLNDVGWRGVTASVSDLVAKGIKPSLSLFSLYGRSLDEIKEISRGVFEALRYYGLVFLGADSNEGEGAIDVVTMGTSRRLPPKLSGARDGDKVVLPRGCWGCVAKCLERGDVPPEAKMHCKRPRVKIELADVISRYSNYISASTDSSDSLAISLWRIAKKSNVSIEIYDIPKPDFVTYFQALYSGEDYLPILVVEEEFAEEIAEEIGGVVVGSVRSGSPRVLFRGNLVNAKGWEWFL